MSIICGNCGHGNQEDAAYCDECGEELVTSTSSYEEEDVTTSSEKSYEEASSTEESDDDAYAEASSTEESDDDAYTEASSTEESDDDAYTEASSTEESDDDTYAEASSTEESDDDAYVEASSTEESDDESEVDTSLQPETEIVDTEKSEESSISLPIGAATRLEIEEPPIKELASPPTTLELPELPTAVLIDQETGERFIVPSEEKTAYIGRINDEFPVQIDLSGIINADLISRVHAAIHREDEVYYVEDAGSANGTWLNETEVQSGTRFRKQLKPGDTIAFGRSQTVKFTFDLED